MEPQRVTTMRRIATEPGVAQRERVAMSAPSTVIETLYNNPDAKIVSFSTIGHRPRYAIKDDAQEIDDEDGNLAWCSPLERTIAVGKKNRIPQVA